MAAKLYALAFSHPSNAAAKMLEIKGIDYRRVDLMPGMHPIALRLTGFAGGTVPGLALDGRRLQGSRTISRALDEVRPDPPLFPADPKSRSRVEEAERWGDAELQPTPRRLLRWGLARDAALRRILIEQVVPRPLATGLARISGVQARQFARKSHADDDSVRLALERLPRRLDHVDELTAAGVIGGEHPNAADLQIASTLRVLLAFADIRPVLEGRPAAALAVRHFPQVAADVPPFLPSSWLSPLRS